MILNKSSVEDMCDRAGIKPSYRGGVHGVDVFICEGFSMTPDVTFRRFGVGRGEFPWGCYCTIWWVARGEERFDVGMPMFFDAFHNPELDLEGKKIARRNRALDDVTRFITQRKKAKNGFAV